MNRQKTNNNSLYVFAIFYLILLAVPVKSTYTARPARQVHTNVNSCTFIPGTNKFGSIDFGGNLSSTTLTSGGFAQVYQVTGMSYMGLKIIGLPGTSWFVAHDFISNYVRFYTDTSGTAVKSFNLVAGSLY